MAQLDGGGGIRAGAPGGAVPLLPMAQASVEGPCGDIAVSEPSPHVAQKGERASVPEQGIGEQIQVLVIQVRQAAVELGPDLGLGEGREFFGFQGQGRDPAFAGPGHHHITVVGIPGNAEEGNAAVLERIQGIEEIHVEACIEVGIIQDGVEVVQQQADRLVAGGELVD